MGKEVSLSDLSRGAVKPSINVKPAEGIKRETVPVTQQNIDTTVSRDPMRTATKISVSELAKSLPKKEEEQAVDSPIIEAAFSSLTNTLNERGNFL